MPPSTNAVTIYGTVAPGFEPVREVFAENFRERDELGAAVAVYYRGDLVVDLWGGYRDTGREHPWESDTMVLVASATKGMTAAAIAVALSGGCSRSMTGSPTTGRRSPSTGKARSLSGSC